MCVCAHAHMCVCVYVYVCVCVYIYIWNLPVNAGDANLILGLRRSPREGNGNPLQFSCLGNPLDRRAWWATVHGVTKCWA